LGKLKTALFYRGPAKGTGWVEKILNSSKS